MFHPALATHTDPFDPLTVLLARHAQHVVLIHFPVALFLAAVAFDLAAQWNHKRVWTDAAYLNFVMAAVSLPFVIATGLLAWHFQFGGQKLQGLLLLHLGLASVASLLMVATCWLYAPSRRTRLLRRARFALEGAAVAALVLAAHLGGFLSGVNHPG